MRRYVQVAGLLAAVAMGASGCGGDGGNDRADYVDAFTGAADETLSGDEQRCVAEAIVDVIGVEALEEAEVLDQIEENPEGSLEDHGLEVDDAQAAELADSTAPCLDTRAFLAEDLTTGPDPLSPEVAACYAEAIPDDALERTFALGIIGGDAAVQADTELSAEFTDAATSCQAPAG